MKLIFTIVFMGLAFLSGCSIINQQADRENLGDDDWNLVSIDKVPLSISNATLRFDQKEDRVSGVAACNNFTADYEMMRNALKFEDIVTTKKFCEELMDEENQIITNLQNVKRFEVKANMLYLYSADKLLLVYKR